MYIRITGRLGQTRTDPERAEVEVGETVQWSIEVTSRTRHVPSVAWEVYFDHASPFRQRSYSVTTAVQVPLGDPPRDEEGVYIGRMEAGEANEPGEYKYGVRAVNEATRQALSDDDPYIIVRWRPR
jgi:hypothetical protein